MARVAWASVPQKKKKEEKKKTVTILNLFARRSKLSLLSLLAVPFFLSLLFPPFRAKPAAPKRRSGNYLFNFFFLPPVFAFPSNGGPMGGGREASLL